MEKAYETLGLDIEKSQGCDADGGSKKIEKSTRVYALIRFLEDRGEKPTGYLYHNKIAVGREYLHSFYVIGKEITRNG